MKKIIFSIIIIVFAFSVMPIIITSAKAKTIADLKKEVSALKSKYQSTENQKAQTKSEIKQTQQNINNSLMEIENNRTLRDEAIVEIEALNIEIAKMEEDLKVTMSNYQISSGENIYLEYVFNADSYADMVYRYTLTKQIADYSTTKLEEWDAKISYNEQLKIDLAAREVDLSNLIKKLDKNLTALDKQIDKYDEVALDIQTEIKTTEALIKSLQDLGCGENDDIEECLAVKGDTRFLRPLTKATISSEYGYRTNPITGAANSFHSGVDMAGNKEGTAIYSVANGVVGKVVIPTSKACGGRKLYIYHTINGKKYTSAYLHLLDVNVKVGQAVTNMTVIGTVGGGAKTKAWESCSTGAHLHFSIAYGWYGTTCSSGCYTSSASYNANLHNPKTPFKLPSKGGSFSSRYF